MRRLTIGLACAIALTAVAPRPAAAQGPVDVRSHPPAGLRAGETWTAHLFVHGSARELAAADPPTILIHNDAEGWSEIRATRVPGERGAYTAAVVFPSGGTWTYHVHDPINGGGYDFDPVVVAAQGGSGGRTAALVAALGLALFTAAAIVRRLRRRSQLA